MAQPNESLGNEGRYQNIVGDQLQNITTSTDFAELVLSSHCGMKVSVAPSTANFDVSYTNSPPYKLFDENESVLIGYDHLKEEYQMTEDIQEIVLYENRHIRQELALPCEETVPYNNQNIRQDLPLPCERNTTSSDTTAVMGACVTCENYTLLRVPLSLPPCISLR